MAVTANTIWECRSTATGTAMQNGGGFDGTVANAGTDWSQQNGAQYNLSGATSAGAGNIVLHGSAAADMIGNVCYVVSGTNFTSGLANGRFLITGCTPGVSFTCGTNQAGTAICTGVGATGVINIGGALSLGSTDDSFFECCQAGNIVYIKGGSSITYTLGGTVSISAAGGAQNPIKVVAYNSSRTDAPTGTTRPTLDCGAVSFTAGANWNWYGLIFKSSVATTVMTAGGSNSLINCKFTATTTTAGKIGLSGGANNLLINCEFVAYRGIGFKSSVMTRLINCYAHDCDIGFQLAATGNPHVLNNCIAEGCVTKGIDISGANTTGCIISNCTVYGAENKLGTGINFATGNTNMSVFNTILYGLVTGITHADTQSTGYDDFNAYYNNTNDVSAAGQWQKGANSVATNPSFKSIAQVTVTTATTSNSGNTLVKSSATFVTAGVTAGRDFVYISNGGGGATVGVYSIVSVDSETQITSGQAPGNSTADVSAQITTGHNLAVGGNMKGIASPSAFPAALSTAFVDIGAVQRKEDYPTAGTVQTGTVYSNTELTGSYDGSDRWTDPGASNVKTGTAYKANSTTNNQTGSYDGSDRWTDPTEAAVKTGTTYKANSTSVNKTGTYDGSDRWTDPTEAAVKTGTTYKANSTSVNKTGTYDGSDRWTDPGDTHVETGVTYKANSTSVNKTGSFSGSGGPVDDIANYQFVD